MCKLSNFCLFILLVISFMPTTVFGQAATIVSEREPIVVYSEKDLNPKQPGYEWTGSTLLQDIRVIDGMGNKPQTGQDVLISDGKIQAVGKTGSLDIPKDVRVIDGDGVTSARYLLFTDSASIRDVLLFPYMRLEV